MYVSSSITTTTRCKLELRSRMTYESIEDISLVAFLSDIWISSDADSAGRASLLDEPVSDSRPRATDSWTDFLSARPTNIFLTQEGLHSPTNLEYPLNSCDVIARFSSASPRDDCYKHTEST